MYLEDWTYKMEVLYTPQEQEFLTEITGAIYFIKGFVTFGKVSP